jgi:amidohydrolase family protein
LLVFCEEVYMESYKYVSADSHLVEPEDLYVTRMDKRFRSRAPRAEVRNGETFMVVEGSLEVSLDADVLLATDEKHRPVLDQSAGGRHEKTRPGGLDPHLRLLDQDVDNIAAEVVYPNWGLYFFATPDPEYQREAMRVYNEYIAEYCRAEGKRLTPVGLLPLKGPIEWAVEAAERCAALGMPEVMVAVAPKRPYHDPHYQPLWDALQNLGLMVAMHAGCYDEPFVDFSYQSVMPQSLIVEGKIILLERGMVNLISGAIPQELSAAALCPGRRRNRLDRSGAALDGSFLGRPSPMDAAAAGGTAVVLFRASVLGDF